LYPSRRGIRRAGGCGLWRRGEQQVVFRSKAYASGQARAVKVEALFDFRRQESLPGVRIAREPRKFAIIKERNATISRLMAGNSREEASFPMLKTPTDSNVQKLTDWIDGHADEIVSALQGVLRIPSLEAPPAGPNAPFGQTLREALDYTLALCDRLGF